MAVTCTHSYSFVSIETLSPGQACVLELHKALTVIPHTIWYGYSHSTGFLFLALIHNNCRKYQNEGLFFFHTDAIFIPLTLVMWCWGAWLSNILLKCISHHVRISIRCWSVSWPQWKSRCTVHYRCCLLYCVPYECGRCRTAGLLATQLYICGATASIIMQWLKHQSVNNVWELNVYQWQRLNLVPLLVY